MMDDYTLCGALIVDVFLSLCCLALSFRNLFAYKPSNGSSPRAIVEHAALTASIWSVGWFLAAVILVTCCERAAFVCMLAAALNTFFVGIPMLYASLRLGTFRAFLFSLGSLFVIVALVTLAVLFY